MGEYYYRKSGKNLFFFLSGDRVAMIAATAAYGAGKVWMTTSGGRIWTTELSSVQSSAFGIRPTLFSMVRTTRGWIVTRR